jgi:chemotaxis protein CheC
MNPLTETQLKQLRHLCHRGAAEASQALARWLDRDATIELDSIEQMSLEEASTSLGVSDSPCCACIMGMVGALTGRLMFCFEDASGLLLCSLLGEENSDEAEASWNELRMSAALETANIVGSSYVSALANAMSSSPVLPTPPTFVRDFAASLIEFAVMDQAMQLDQVLFARTKFFFEGTAVLWSLLLIPDPPSLAALTNWSEGNSMEQVVQ